MKEQRNYKMRTPKLVKIGNVYTQDSKEQAVAYHKSTGTTVSKDASYMGISTTTLKKWIDDAVSKSLVSASDIKLVVGDKVRIIGRQGSKEGLGFGYNSSMEKYEGKEVTIENINTGGGIRLVGVSYTWHKNWLEKVGCEQVAEVGYDRVEYITVGKGINSPLMAEMTLAHKDGRTKKVYVYHCSGAYSTYANGIPPRDWEKGLILSFTKVDNIRTVKGGVDVSTLIHVVDVPKTFVIDNVEYVKYAAKRPKGIININGTDYVKRGY